MTIDLSHLRSYFSGDIFAARMGITIESAAEDRVVVAMDITDAHRNALGGVQGGAIFTLADLAFAVHSNLLLACGVEGAGATVGQSCSVSYLKSTRGSRLFGTSTCLSRGRNVCVYRVDITDDLGVHIAEVICNGFTVHKA